MNGNCKITDALLVSRKNSVRAVSKRILSIDGNHLRLVLGVIISVVAAMLPIFLSSLPLLFGAPVFDEHGEIMISDFAAVLELLTIIAVLVFISMPIISGVLLFSAKLVRGTHPTLVEILAPFRMPRLFWRAIMLGAVTVITVALPIFATVGGIAVTCAVIEYLGDISVAILLAVVIFMLCLILLALAVSLYASSYLFFVSEFTFRGMKIKKAISESVVRTQGKHAIIVREMLKLLPHAILSVLTLGVYFVLLAAPRMLVTYFVLVNKLLREEI